MCLSNFSPKIRDVPKACIVRILPMTSSANVPALATCSSEPTVNFDMAPNMMPPVIMMTGKMDVMAKAKRQDRA